ncbi:MAG TPA: superoxide dismutase [Candidatus Hydrogenedentes bacterium]|nr:superoxide dismutase [Candidatus Hydrogenedentota bacterium]HOL78057.1 superoxide dismutase [Candidatus Hydrogenedentota bacterium]HPO86911.1 superoxide dismutase [Candidatus Hydrogenedentota bacterium]
MSTDRRGFLKTAGGVMVAANVLGVSPLVGSAMAATESAEKKGAGALTEHVLPPLPYPFDALEPYIDAKTMEIHHDKHHAAYVKGLNTAEAALAKARAENDFAMIEYWSKKAAFNGGGHFLHSMFWKVMAPKGQGGGEPKGKLAELIERDFGSFAAFKAHFSAAAKNVEGAGWALLHYRPEDGRLIVLQAENQHKLSPWGTTPILGIDVWEHAYYLKYQNNRGEYVDQWWNVVNWKQVAENLKALGGI